LNFTSFRFKEGGIMNRNFDLNSLKSIKEEVIDIIRPGEKDIVFLGGSLIEQMGNKYSDLDVFVLYEKEDHYDKHDFQYNYTYKKVSFSRIKEFSLDIEHWDLGILENIIDQFNSIDFQNIHTKTTNLIKPSLEIPREDMTSVIHRFINGIPVHNENGFYKLHESLSKEKFYKFQIRYLINTADGIYDDVMGNIESDAAEVALYNARDLIICVVQAYLFSIGVSTDREKWAVYKLHYHKNRDEKTKFVWNEFEKLYLRQALGSHSELLKNAEDILRFYNEVISIIEENVGGI